MSNNCGSSPFGNGLAVNETNLYNVLAILVKSYGCRVYTALSLNDLSVVNLNLIVISADYRSPSKYALSIAYLIVHLVVTSNKHVGSERGVSANSTNSYGVVNALNALKLVNVNCGGAVCKQHILNLLNRLIHCSLEYEVTRSIL